MSSTIDDVIRSTEEVAAMDTTGLDEPARNLVLGFRSALVEWRHGHPEIPPYPWEAD